MNTATKIAVSIGSIAVIATAGIGGFLLATSNDATVPTTQTATSVPQSTNPAISTNTSNASSTTTSSYKDGTYSATASYYVPHGGTNSITATVTIVAGKITSATTTHQYGDSESSMYIDSFESGVSNAATGVSLAEATFSRIGGASLTTEGFNSAIDSIRSQASA